MLIILLAFTFYFIAGACNCTYLIVFVSDRKCFKRFWPCQK